MAYKMLSLVMGMSFSLRVRQSSFYECTIYGDQETVSLGIAMFSPINDKLLTTLKYIIISISSLQI